jgi:hypothetical protein
VAADSMPRQLAFGERESGWREADRAVDRAARRFGAGAVRPAVLVDPALGAPLATAPDQIPDRLPRTVKAVGRSEPKPRR